MNQNIFEYEMKVRDYECDAQGHVNNANYQHYFEVTRHEFMEKVGLNFFDLHNKGIDAVVSRVAIRYKIPLIGMDVFKCTISQIERVSLKYIFHQEIIRLSDNALCAKGQIEVVNLINGKLTKPDVFDDAFKEYL
ncbi:MAG: thioesterase family protein [Dysgonamonadaceae bacterium]|jgi:acyl-CoA thioester hydrolase|nr:thioesterase family protein [Dysgonamonadaceae bacterium]MDD3309397.1 thioesterase family protein [Dysgonamonadaceae bacterium]MDD3900315.1 thioesterase family protein [Dysgonamonadaceae bacterium]MDD4398390.1 thioesterase family protein [Dysgonamonadaceae bacterium]MEA5080118.1 thioesterase family protein [Dysgonamonadaceae bacterium]